MSVGSPDRWQKFPVIGSLTIQSTGWVHWEALSLSGIGSLPGTLSHLSRMYLFLIGKTARLLGDEAATQRPNKGCLCLFESSLATGKEQWLLPARRVVMGTQSTAGQSSSKRWVLAEIEASSQSLGSQQCHLLGTLASAASPAKRQVVALPLRCC